MGAATVILALEGLDGAGKTTVGHLLAGMIGARYVPLPPARLRLISNALFTDISSTARYLHYLSGVLAVAEDHHEPEVIVADRYVASAHALHLGVPGPLADELRRLALPAPKVTFCLDVDEEVRRARLRARGTELDPFERLLETDGAFRRQVAETMQSLPGTYVIDTTSRTPEQVAEHAKRIWQSLPRSIG